MSIVTDVSGEEFPDPVYFENGPDLYEFSLVREADLTYKVATTKFKKDNSTNKEQAIKNPGFRVAQQGVFVISQVFPEIAIEKSDGFSKLFLGNYSNYTQAKNALENIRSNIISCTDAGVAGRVWCQINL